MSMHFKLPEANARFWSTLFLCVSLTEQVLLADADLNDPRLVYARDADVLEYPVIKLALPGVLNDNLVSSIEQRLEG